MSSSSEVPHGWENKKLGDVFTLTSGKTKPNDTEIAPLETENFPVYGGNGILGFSSSWNVSGENIVIGRVGEYCGVTRYIDNQAWITDNALYTKSVANNVEVKYLVYLLILSDLSKLRSKGGQPLVSQKPIYDLAINLPPLEEQRKIAAILSTWDETIEQQTRLIELKRERKRGLMQQLLTGRVRFKEFEGLEWDKLVLSDINQASNQQINPAKFPDEMFEYYSIPAYQEHGKPDTTQGQEIKSNKQLISGGSILFGKLNPRLLKIWLVTSRDTGMRKIASTEFMLLMPDERVQLEYLYHALHEPGFLATVMGLVGGSTGSHQRINPTGFFATAIWVPPLPEQRKIAAVLSAADAELETLMTQLEALKEQKRGLMQQLLTGETRVQVA